MYYFYEGRTIRGLGLMGWALVIFVGAAVVTGVTTAVIGLLYGAALQNPPAMFGALLGLLVGICAADVAALAAAILFLIGFYQVHAGRHEYGLEQTRSVERALIFLVVYIVLGAVSAVYSVTGSILLGVRNPLTSTAVASGLVLNPVGALFAGLSLDASARPVAAPPVRSRLRTALIIGVVGSAVGPGLTLLATAGTLTVDTLTTGILAAALGGQGLSALSLFLFWLAYQEARRSLLAGSPAPVLPRVEQLYPWLYRPWAPYPWPPSAPPPQQPPKP